MGIGMLMALTRMGPVAAAILSIPIVLKRRKVGC